MSKSTQPEATVPDALARYEPVIGLEMHVQLKTASKIFCACSTRFGNAPNSNTCPVCLGLPGALPVFNKRALELAIRAALALHCTVHQRSRFARKNYFYPDLPKGYQISMYEMPLATGGWLEVESGAARKRIGITRLHLEDDAAKNMHEGFPDSAEKTYIDYNRGGVPLIEIVSEPDLRSPEDAHAYLTALRQVLVYTGVSDCNMEEGSLRCDANVSVRPRGTQKFGIKAEVKNLNSFRYLQRALEYEIERQVKHIESGGQVTQETRLYNVAAGRTEPMRSKEFAHDYRYFPEPDLLPVYAGAALCPEIAAALPELPDARRQRYVRDFGITPYAAAVLTDSRELGDYFEAVMTAGGAGSFPAKTAANWIQTELLRWLKDAGKEITESPVAPAALAELLAMVERGEVTAASGKTIFERMFATGKPAQQIAGDENRTQISDSAAVELACRKVIAKNPDQAAKFRAGNEGVFKFFVGQVMRATRGQANPQAVNDILRRMLSAA